MLTERARTTVASLKRSDLKDHARFLDVADGAVEASGLGMTAVGATKTSTKDLVEPWPSRAQNRRATVPPASRTRWRSPLGSRRHGWNLHRLDAKAAINKVWAELACESVRQDIRP